MKQISSDDIPGAKATHPSRGYHRKMTPFDVQFQVETRQHPSISQSTLRHRLRGRMYGTHRTQSFGAHVILPFSEYSGVYS